MIESTAVNSNDRLTFTAFLAIAFHVLILFGIGFTAPIGDIISPTLNITLATHKSEKTPERADFLAQHNQEASGTAEETKELLSQHQAEIASTEINEVMPPPQQKTEHATEKQQDILSTEADTNIRVTKTEDPDSPEKKDEKLAQDFDIPNTSQEKAALQAKLDRINQQEAERPRIRRMTSVSTKSSKDAEYLNNWNSRVEQVGNTNFPQAALKNRIFGEIIIAVALNANGTIHNVKIVEPSEHDILNQSALQIVRLASPFTPIPTEVLDGHDKLEIIRIWQFEITGLTSKSTKN